MSQRDLVAELRSARPTAPDEVRERVRLIAARDTTPSRRRLKSFTWRRALVVAAPAAAAIVVAVAVTRPTTTDRTAALDTATQGYATRSAPPAPNGAAGTELAPLTAKARVQDYNASLALRLKNAGDVSDGVKQVQRITASLGGFPVSIHAGSHGKEASADLVLKVPRARVQEAIRRFAALGTITGEDVHVQDLQAGLNAVDRRIARLQKQLQDARAAKDEKRIAALTAQIQRLQRQATETRRTAHFATVSVHLETPPIVAEEPAHGPWHALGVALKWTGIGAVYALVFGTPLLLVALAWRYLRRRREDALLSRP